jgi:AcrR family transcriptional regulator
MNGKLFSMPRRSVLEAERTRGRILAETVQHLSVRGVTGTSLAAIAESLGMSKAGVVGPFRSREDLLVAAFDLGIATFHERVIHPALGLRLRPGTERLRLLIDSWTDYLVDSPFQGGCLLTSASFELDGIPGTMRDHMTEAVRQWKSFLHSQLAEASEAGHGLPGDVADVAATLIGLGMALNQSVQLLPDPGAQAQLARLMYEAAGL